MKLHLQERKCSVSANDGGTVVKNPPASARDTGNVGLIPGPGRSPGGGFSNPLQYSCLENSMDRGAWWARVHGVAEESDTTKQLNNNNLILTL